ncbi:hypothetical protein [Corallococcus aberystwythensis]|uniref:hypothetical protein n=1 Tax=Corallococcus aberystwythensis TaxID=2316722 RepID=UPI001315639D|nr:hypothetical protein [Corallococcus aberystwythensis]
MTFAPFPRALLGYRNSPLVAVAGLSFALAIGAILSRALKPSRLLSVLALMLAVPVFLSMLLVMAVSFAPFPLALLEHPIGIMAGLYLALALMATLSQASNPSRLLSVLALILAVPVCFFFSGKASQFRAMYRLHAVATEACQTARENPRLTSEDVFEHAVQIAKLSPSQSESLGLRCNNPAMRVYITDGFDPVWVLSADGSLN